MTTTVIQTRNTRWLFILAGLTLVAGVCISLQIRSRIAQTESTTARLTAEMLRINTEQELLLFVDVLESVRALHALSDAVNQAAMDEFIEKGLIYQHAVLGTFGLTQKIGPWLRVEIEEKAAANPGTSYRVVKQGPDGGWVPSEPQAVYYPLTWQSRENGLQVPVGFDFLSLNEEARRTIERIERHHTTAVVSSPVSSEGSSAPAYWVFSPVLPRSSDSIYASDAVIGFAVAQLNPATILERVALRSVPSSKLQLTPTRLSAGDAPETIRLIQDTWLYRHSIQALDTCWIFECSLPVSVTGHRSSVALATGLLITALMVSQLVFLGGRTRIIEAAVRSRTEELRIVNLRLEENLQDRKALEEEMTELAASERRRIGRDLHDSLGQKLTGAVFLSRSLLDCFNKIGGVQQTHAKTLNETLKASVAQVRNMARGLAPVTLNDESLRESFQQLVEEMTGLYGVSCEMIDCSETPALDRKVKEQLYLIAREAVNNAARHAHAGRITVRLTCDESRLTLRVEDDGCGFTPQAAGEGMGIRIMRHRASLINAEWSIQSVPGKGTSIEVNRPV